MTPIRPYHPCEVAEALGLAPSTLRIYADTFQELLSPDARPGRSVNGRCSRHRRYAAEDVVVLERAKALLDAGLSYVAVLRQLKGEAGHMAIEPRALRAFGPRRRRAASAEALGPAPSAQAEDALARTNAEIAAIEPVLQSIVDRLAALDERLAVQHEAIRDLRSRIDAVGRRLDQSEAAAAERPNGPSAERRRNWLAHLLGDD